jgi:flavodoxin
MKTAIIYVSYHHNNTEKIAREMATVLDADLKKVSTFDPSELSGYDLLGFGSGIYFGRHHRNLLKLVAKLPATNRKAFIFSTSGRIFDKVIPEYHKAMRAALQKKGFEVIDEFNCPGHDTVIFARLASGGKGLNKGRPNEEDLKNAQAFAQNLKNRFNDMES